MPHDWQRVRWMQDMFHRYERLGHRVYLVNMKLSAMCHALPHVRGVQLLFQWLSIVNVDITDIISQRVKGCEGHKVPSYFILG